MSDSTEHRVRPILGVTHSPPGFAVPRGACDCHTHVFGPAARFPFAPARAYTPGEASVEDLGALQACLGLERVVVVQPSPYGDDNRCTLDALRRLGGRARGVAVLGADTPEAALRRMHAAGVRGARVNLETAGEHDPAAAGRRLRAVAARVAPFGWHVQVYAALPLLAAMGAVLRDLPVPLVVDHYGLARAADGPEQPGLEVLLGLLRDGRAYVKLSAPHRISAAPGMEDAAPIARALAGANPDRAVWGSDWPHPGALPGAARDPGRIERFHSVDDGLALRRLAAWLDDAALLRRVLVDNPARLYGFPDAPAEGAGDGTPRRPGPGGAAG